MIDDKVDPMNFLFFYLYKMKYTKLTNIGAVQPLYSKY